MQILVQNKGEKDIRILLPTGLVFNPVTALIIPAAAESKGFRITVRQVMALIKTLHESKRRFPNWVMVEAEDADGCKVEIKL